MASPSPRFGVLGPLEVTGPSGAIELTGTRQRNLLALLLAAGGSTVPASTAAELLWRDALPANPSAALHSHLSRLRRSLASVLTEGCDLVTRAPGYALVTGVHDVDSSRFELLVARAREASDDDRVELYDAALSLWRGSAYVEFADLLPAQLEGIRLDELRLTVVEERSGALVEIGRAESAVPDLETFVAAHPLREEARALLMRALYSTGRHGDALRHYQEYRTHLADELGLEPSVPLRRLEHEILTHEMPTPARTGQPPAGGAEPPVGLESMQVRYLRRPDGASIAAATVGTGPRVVVVPAWVTSLDAIAAGRDPRSSLMEHLARSASVTLYDRRGTGLSRGEITDFSLAASTDELVSVLEQSGGGVLLAVSQAGPIAVSASAQRPDLVSGLVLFGTFADAADTFRRPEVNRALVDLSRASWRMGAKVLADLYRPGSSTEAGEHLARVLRESADGAVGAGYLEEMYRTDVTDLLPAVPAPALVLHYRHDRLIPYRGGQQLARGLPDAELVPLEGPFHLPDAADLPRIMEAITRFLARCSPRA